jgi:hypothetical protein
MLADGSGIAAVLFELLLVERGEFADVVLVSTVTLDEEQEMINKQLNKRATIWGLIFLLT